MSGCSGARIPEVTLRNQAHGLTEPLILNIITYNIYDLYIESADRAERMSGIAEKLCTLDPDLVGFQESFVKDDRNILISELQKCSRLQYHQYYPSRVVGSGLLISSAFPITERSFHRFNDTNSFFKVREGDWWAGKGVALARVELPDGIGYVDFYNTHAQAGYGNPDYVIIRENQMWELAQFVNNSHSDRTLALLVGDLNSKIGDNAYQIALEGADLVRVMSIDSGVDHIFAVRDANYTFELLETVRIDGSILVDGIEVTLSDHIGYMSIVRVIPCCTSN
ncbi:MAG: endonuclease/exonuclease/phosphatase family protein [Anaerolineales bacterium]